jgi:AcrR family transcriptional regulator
MYDMASEFSGGRRKTSSAPSSARPVRYPDAGATKPDRLPDDLPPGDRRDLLDVWTRLAPGARRPRFSREEIAEAAVRIADAEGIDALSMRRLAAELNAGTMTLYHYVKTKDELLALITDAVMGELIVPADELTPRDWRAAITAIAARSRASLERHPWIFDIVDDPDVGPNGVRHFDQSLQAMVSLPGTLADKLDVISAVDEYVFGYCLHARNNRPEEAVAVDGQALIDYVRTLTASGDYPQLATLIAEYDVEELLTLVQEHGRDRGRFDRNLARLLDGIDADLRRRRRERQRAASR